MHGRDSHTDISVNIMKNITISSSTIFKAVTSSLRYLKRKLGFTRIISLLFLTAFILPLAFIGIDYEQDQSLVESESVCNPYIESHKSSDTLNDEPCPSFTSIDPKKVQIGIDVSHYQGTVMWDKVANSGKSFAITKATGGENYTDPNFIRNWYEIRKHELIRGAYHFFYAGDDPEIQAKHFLKTVGKIRKNDLPPILDIEISDQETSDTLKERALVWLSTVEKKTKRRPIIYTDKTFAKEFLSDPRFGQYYLWLADYSDENPTPPLAWKDRKWFLLQYTQDGQVEGVDGKVDLNHYVGSIDNLKTFIHLSNY